MDNDPLIEGTRRDRFDRLMWATLRFPALIPQVWVNWVAWTDKAKLLDENPSRVDFMAFHQDTRHIVEIDGPSHYAAYDETAHRYTVDERAYAKNLKVARSLEREAWSLTRIARIEVRDAMPEDGDGEDDFGVLIRRQNLVGLLPFPTKTHYPCRPSWDDLALPEVARAIEGADIPF